MMNKIYVCLTYYHCAKDEHFLVYKFSRIVRSYHGSVDETLDFQQRDSWFKSLCCSSFALGQALFPSPSKRT